MNNLIDNISECDDEYLLQIMSILADKIDIENNLHLLSKYISCTNKLTKKCGLAFNKIELIHNSYCEPFNTMSDTEFARIAGEEFDENIEEINLLNKTENTKKRKICNEEKQTIENNIEEQHNMEKEDNIKNGYVIVKIVDKKQSDDDKEYFDDKLFDDECCDAIIETIDEEDIIIENNKKRRRINETNKVRQKHIKFCVEESTLEFAEEKFYDDNYNFNEIKRDTLIFYFKFISFRPYYLKKYMDNVTPRESCLLIINNFNNFIGNKPNITLSEYFKKYFKENFNAICELLKIFYDYNKKIKSKELSAFDEDFSEYKKILNDDDSHKKMKNVYTLIKTLADNKMHKNFIIDCASVIIDAKLVCGGFDRTNLKYATKLWWVVQVENMFVKITGKKYHRKNSKKYLEINNS